MSWKDIIGTVAPTLATALGGPLAGMAAKAATTALFGDEVIPETDLESRIAAAVSTDPDALLKLKQADNEFKVKMEELGVDLEKVHAGDRANARELAAKTSLWPQISLAAAYNIGFLGVIYATFFSNVVMTVSQEKIAMYLLGILSAGLISANTFFLGSSSGSKEKTKMMGGK